MSSLRIIKIILLAMATVPGTLGQPCLNATSEFPAAMAPGYTSKVILSGLTGARGIVFDTAGSILVVSQGSGIVHLSLSNSSGGGGAGGGAGAPGAAGGGGGGPV